MSPRWKKLCKNGEEPSRDIVKKEFEDIFGIQAWRGRGEGAERRHCCYSRVPEEWVPAVKKLVETIRSMYDTAGLEGPSEYTQVTINQIKDKFGALRFYYSTGDCDREFSPREVIDELISACEDELARVDPHYGIPY